MPANVMGDGIDERRWRVLCETTFPSARTPEAIVMALDYCRARGLDVFKKPVHIVPMWNSTLRKEVETVWPGINEIQITASRTREWAGMDAPEWGPDITATFKGRKKERNERGESAWKNVETTLTYPEWCAVTVYRMIGGEPRAFTEPVYWLEAYSRAGGSEYPTDMWIKRPRGQLHKVAKAASLRAAFPEEGDYTAEEMEGKEIEVGGVVIDAAPEKPAKRTMAEISSAKREKADRQEEFLRDLQDVHSLVALDRLEREWEEYLAGQNAHAYTAQEHVEKKRAELSGEQPATHNDTFVPNARERRRQQEPAGPREFAPLPDAMDEAEQALPQADEPTAAQKMAFGELKTWLADAKTEAQLNRRLADKDYQKGVYSLTPRQREELAAFADGRAAAVLQATLQAG
jgi:phage recombination protein Bet